MPDDLLFESFEDALAPEDYDILDDAPLDTPQGLCVRGGCQNPAEFWVRSGDGFLGQCAEHAPERFFVDNEEKATWALRKLGRAKRTIAAADELRQAERNRLDVWYEQRTRREARTVETMERLLVEYLAGRVAKDPKTKTISLPGGTLKSISSQRLEIVDEAAVLAWATENGITQVVKPAEVSKSALKDLLGKNPAGELQTSTRDGLVVPGIEIVANQNPTVTPNHQYRD